MVCLFFFTYYVSVSGTEETSGTNNSGKGGISPSKVQSVKKKHLGCQLKGQQVEESPLDVKPQNLIQKLLSHSPQGRQTKYTKMSN